MEALLGAYFSSDPASSDAAGARVAEAISSKEASVLELVLGVRPQLTSPHEEILRRKAVALLVQVVTLAGANLNQQELITLCGFFNDKLTDWQCAPVAAQGCLQVLQGRQPPPQLPADSVLQLVRNFMEVQVQGSTASQRLVFYKLWQLILEDYGAAAAASGLDLVDHMITVMDNEREPRCLLAAFSCVQSLGHLYQQSGPASTRHMVGNAGELFDVAVVPYFPMMFTPPKNNAVGLTREQLLEGLVQAMASSPEFAPLAIPLLNEKLGSDFKQAKADVLVALPVCCKAYGAPVMRPLLTPVWLMLKPELLAPGAVEGLPADELAAKRAAAAAAAAALRGCCAALGSGELDQHVLRDVCVDDLMNYLGLGDSSSEGTGGVPWWQGPAAALQLPGRARGRLSCIAAVLGAVAAASPASCSTVCQDVLQPLVLDLEHGSSSTQQQQQEAAGSMAYGSSGSSWCGRPPEALSAALAVLCAVLGALADADWACSTEQPPRGMSQLLPKLLQLLLYCQGQLRDLLQQQPVPPIAEAELVIRHLRLFGSLVKCKMTATTSLQQGHQEVALLVGGVTPLAVSGDDADVALALSWAEKTSIRREAVQVLQLLGNCGELGCALLSEAAWPLLQQALQPDNNAPHQQQQQVVTLLGQLASSSSPVAWEVLTWLQPLIDNSLAAAAAAGQPQVALVHQLYQCQNSSCLPALGSDWTSEQSMTAAAAAGQQLAAWDAWATTTTSSSSSTCGHVGGTSTSGGRSEVQQQLLESCLPLAVQGTAQLVRSCSSPDQAQLALTAFEWSVTSAGQLAAAGNSAGLQASVKASLAAAVLASLLPAVQQGPSIAQVLEALVSISYSSTASSLASSTAAVAAAAVANKWATPAAAAAGAGAAAEGVGGGAAVLSVLLQLLQAADSPGLPAADPAVGGQLGASATSTPTSAASLCRYLQVISWLCRALALQRDDAWLQGLRHAVRVLAAASGPAQSAAPASPASSAGGPVQAAAGVQQQVVAAAARFFSILVDDSAGVAGLQLQGSFHVRSRPLWQQKAYIMAMQELTAALHAAQAGAAAGGSGSATGTPQQCLPLFLGCAALLAAVPLQVFCTAADEAVPLLLDSLEVLSLVQYGTSSSGGSGNTAAIGHATASAAVSAGRSGTAQLLWTGDAQELLQLLHGCLLKVTQVVMDPKLRPALEPLVSQLIAVLTQLTSVQQQPSAAPAAVGDSSKDTAGAVCPAPAVGRQGDGSSSSSWGKQVAAAEVREVALLSLTAVMELPYHLLHPHRQLVLKAVTAALDDDKRAVRCAAVRCKRVWSSY